MNYPDYVAEALRLLLAVSLGGGIGLERRLRLHPAGLHTNALIALGACAYVVAGLALHGDSPARLAAQVVSGVGFLCGGIILHQGPTVSGLNTAATSWCSAAVGVLAAVDRPWLAVLVASIVLFTNVLLHWLEHSVLPATRPATSDGTSGEPR
jgi:putative Mg2+ transporter-C (MgtC) family protein